MKKTKIYAMLVILLLITSCEKYVSVNSTTASKDGSNNVTLHIVAYEHRKFTPFSAPPRHSLGDSRSSEPSADNDYTLADICKKISFAVFYGDEKVKTINQSISEENFGTVNFSLQEGTYDIVVIAHSGTGNCTISSPEKITFTNNKVTDTFYYYGSLEVSEDTPTEKEINLTRAVGMFRLHINDEIPNNAKQFKFYYTGGSSTFDAVTGSGCVNSKQTEYKTIDKNTKDYDVFTFPHNPIKKIKLDITAQNASGTTIASNLFENVTVERNFITTYSGNFFSGDTGGGEGNSGFHFTFDAKWEGTNDTPF